MAHNRVFEISSDEAYHAPIVTTLVGWNVTV